MSARPPIWVISLERASDRRAFIRRELDSLGVEYEIVDAVDGRTLDERALCSYSEWRTVYRYGRGLGRGMVACSMSHLHAYERIAAAKIAEVVIMEDDVRPLKEFPGVLDARTNLPDDWDVVTFHSLFDWAVPRPVDDTVIAGKYRICSYERNPMGTQAYLIKHDAARRVLDVAYPICLPPDELLFRKRPAGLTIYGIEPSPVVHEEFGSQINQIRDPARPTPLTAAPLRHVVRFAGRLDRRLQRSKDRRVATPPDR
jgi:glycosyl transferase family 25